ncbi:phage portal protein family protein [Corynebacterium striatum]|uniref:phage portal protein family protein n=1 Tax=Corynebacterium striatum TaxID=43770 RepID=UPI0034D7099B
MEPIVRREVGAARTVSNTALAEDNWALRFPASSRVFAKMGREDAQVKSVLRAVMLPIRRATWYLEPNGAPDEVVSLVAEDLRMQVKGEDPNKPVAARTGLVSWEKHLEDALRALQFGHMFFEQVYAPGRDGRDHLVKLAPRWPGTITDIQVAADGGLASIKQRAAAGVKNAESVEIPVSRLVGYVFDDVGSQWIGQSVLRPAYKHWKLRDALLRMELNAIDRNSMGVPVYEGSELALDPDTDLKNGQEIVQSFRAGKSSGASIPAKAKLSLVGVSGQVMSPREAITYHDNMIAKSVLAHFLNLEGKGGSYALAETQSDLFIQSLQTTAEWIADVATQHVVEDLVRVAFPEHDGLMPRITLDPIASKKEIQPGDLAQLKNAGLILADKDLEEDLRRRYVLPPKQRLMDALQSKKDRQALEAQFGVTLTDAPDEGTTDTSQPSTSAPDERLQAMASSLVRVESMMNKLRGDFDVR